jgi:hypothetical protein
MVNTNKILTVSYGTFSCTLEGFDESFDMMKSIAEYFRDLAADDRFFGAEPPTPDAEMLARIAEHQAARRVEARQESGSIVLRPSVAAAAPEPPASTVAAPAAVPAPSVPASGVQVEPQPEQPAMVSQPLPATDTEPAAKAPVQDAPAITTPQPTPAQVEQATVEVHTDIAEAVQQTPAPASVATPTTRLDEESVAEKLSRIRAVVSRNTAEKSNSTAFIEDEHAEEFEAEAETEADASFMIDSVLRQTKQEVSEAPTEPEINDEGSDEQPVDANDPVIDDPQLAEDIAEASEAGFEEDIQEDIAGEAAPQPQPRARIIRMKREQADDTETASQSAPEATAKPQADGLSAEDEEDLMRELAEVEEELNLTRLADAEGAQDDLDDDLSDPEEQGSIFAEAPEDAVFQDADDADPAPAVAREGNTDVGRLMDKAQQEMERPDGAHRRSAIAHLRAAVQATRAETEAGGGLGRGDDSLDAYRDDLKSVVRPRRPVAGDATPDTARRPVKKPAPLKLVAEQRIDTPEPTESRVVRPRRVSLDDDTPQQIGVDQSQSEIETFAEFAAQAGVKELSEVMEAAAAYMSYVEGRQKFSRPQLMNKARQLEEWQFSREDGLRSFGQLLRDGKIEKLKGGRFTVSDELIGYKPDARAAG